MILNYTACVQLFFLAGCAGLQKVTVQHYWDRKGGNQRVVRRVKRSTGSSSDARDVGSRKSLESQFFSLQVLQALQMAYVKPCDDVEQHFLEKKKKKKQGKKKIVEFTRRHNDTVRRTGLQSCSTYHWFTGSEDTFLLLFLLPVLPFVANFLQKVEKRHGRQKGRGFSEKKGEDH